MADANGGVPNKYFLRCRIQPMRGATYDFCATCGFNLWVLDAETGPKYQKISFRSVPKPGRETAPVFSLGGRGAPKKRLGFWGPTAGARRASVFWPPPPRTQTP